MDGDEFQRAIRTGLPEPQPNVCWRCQVFIPPGQAHLTPETAWCPPQTYCQECAPWTQPTSTRRRQRWQ